ncbi:hypothetical protein BDA96_01G475700 [Sorghum bicolor]|uniref:Uncharacterized protein n=1 Tax=Sorghum bicolor TaxID=4558 RepID=A0A921V256_SORBI|nr:hypothetical protein BDA96_01G475700 [Sorghum bicolor]
MPPRRKPARPSILVAPGVSRARTSLPGPRARAFTALALLSTALLLLLHFAASRGSPLSSARSRGSPLSDSDSAKNKTESREGICEHLQSTAPHNATGNEALITEDDIKRRWKYKERMFVEGFSLVWCADDCPCC